VKAVRDRAAFTLLRRPNLGALRMVIEEDLVVTQMVIIPNHTLAINFQNVLRPGARAPYHHFAGPTRCSE
jgi:hypothetical protein